MAVALLSQLATLHNAYEAAAREAASVALDGATEEHDELRLAKQDLPRQTCATRSTHLALRVVLPDYLTYLAHST